KTNGLFAGAAGWAGAAPCANAGAADSMPTTSPRAIRSIEASSVEWARKGDTLAYSGLHENGHYLVSKEHALAAQGRSRSVAPQLAGLDEPLEARAEPAPDVDAVPDLYDICLYSVYEPEPGEQRVAETLIGG